MDLDELRAEWRDYVDGKREWWRDILMSEGWAPGPELEEELDKVMEG